MITALGNLAGWAFAVLLALIFVWSVSWIWRGAGQYLKLVWLPFVLLFVAAVGLTATAAGEDLAVGLLDMTGLQPAYLFVALTYWALATWYIARLGTVHGFGDRERWHEDDHYWLTWIPRFLGAATFIVMSISVSIAARHTVEDAIPLLSPALIVTAFVGFLAWQDPRSENAFHRAIDDLSDRPWITLFSRTARLPMAAEQSKRALVGKVLGFIIGLIAGGLFGAIRKDVGDLLIGLAVFSTVGYVTLWALFAQIRIVLGILFVLGITFLAVGLINSSEALVPVLVISFSAIATLLFVVRRLSFKITKAVASWHAISGLLAVPILAVLWTFIDMMTHSPITIGVFGTVAVAILAIGSYVMVLGLVDHVGRRMAKPVPLLLILLVIGVVSAIPRNYHAIRLCGDYNATSCEAGQQTKRASVSDAAKAWYKRARVDWLAKGQDGPVPMIYVATAGGGIRAAYWTSLVLEKLENRLTNAKSDAADDQLAKFSNYLFAISGVSGGSLGAVAYTSKAKGNEGRGVYAHEGLEKDFLAPALATFAFIDVPASLLPDLGFLGGRSYSLEKAWHEANKENGVGGLEGPFLDLFELPVDEADSWQPMLLLNATHQQTGKRIITSHVTISEKTFLDAFDMHDLVGEDMPTATAAHNSARFTYISPAGKLTSRQEKEIEKKTQHRGAVLDGGYFENFGATTALQLSRAAVAAIDGEPGPGVRPIYIQISSDPSMQTRDLAKTVTEENCRGSEIPLPYESAEWKYLFDRIPIKRIPNDDGPALGLANEIFAPLAGILSVRSAHGLLASKELATLARCTKEFEEKDVPMVKSDHPAAIPQGKGELSITDIADAAIAPPVPEVTSPIFVHFAMCGRDSNNKPLAAPLSWVLSTQAQQDIEQMLVGCEDNQNAFDDFGAIFGLH